MKNIKIGMRLIVAFVIVTLLASIGGVVGIAISKNLDKQYGEALVVNGFAQGEIGRMNTHLQHGGSVTRDIIMLTDAKELQEVQQEIVDVRQQIDAALADMKISCTTPEEVAQIAIIEKNLPLYRDKQNEVINLGLANKNDEALNMFREEAQPYLDACLAAANELAEMNVRMGNEVSAELSKQATTSIAIVMVVIVISMIVAIFIGIVIARSVSNPVQIIEAAAKEMANGHLNATINYEAGDELGALCDSMRMMMKRLKFYMDEITEITGLLASGDLNVKDPTEEFLGDFRPVQLSLENLVKALNTTMTQINQSADQVSAGSEQVSSGSQALAQGATEQASSVEELAATIGDISNQVSMTAQNAADAREQMGQAGDETNRCNEQMQEMIGAMNEISQKSDEIGKIIKTIEDIAFQTNILSLNAAVEAARAGEAGKGFAVVADEVRNLANKSAEASKNTAALIEGSIMAIGKGVKIAGATAESLLKVVDSANTVATTVEQISDAASAQAASIAQVTQGIDQISSVVQTNSATAEESAAASEELSGQAQVLKDLVSQFKLKNDGFADFSAAPSPSRTQAKPTAPSIRTATGDKY